MEIRKNKLGMKALAGLFFLAAALTLCVCISVGIQYLREKMEEYGQIAFSYARTAAEYIDGDRVLFYLETGRKDDYYCQGFFECIAETDQFKILLCFHSL